MSNFLVVFRGTKVWNWLVREGCWTRVLDMEGAGLLRQVQSENDTAESFASPIGTNEQVGVGMLRIDIKIYGGFPWAVAS